MGNEAFNINSMPVLLNISIYDQIKNGEILPFKM